MCWDRCGILVGWKDGGVIGWWGGKLVVVVWYGCGVVWVILSKASKCTI